MELLFVDAKTNATNESPIAKGRDMPEIIGLDIGSHSIKLVGFNKTSKGLFLTCLGMKKIPPGLDQNDIGGFSILLKDLTEEIGMQSKKVKLTVSGSGIQIRRLTMPSIPNQELIKALPWEMKDHLPYPVETARIQYHIIGKLIEDGIKKLDLLVAACPNSLIERTLSIAEGAGFQVIHLDIGAFALWNMLLTLDRLKIGETTALIDLGSEKMSLYLFKDDILQFSREMTPAGADLTRAIIDAIPFERDLHFLHERAEKIKEHVGIPSIPPGMKGVDETLDLSKISFLMRPVLEKWVAEISRSLDYYRNQFYGERIDRLLLTGGGAHLKNVVPLFEDELHLPVEIFNPLKEMPFDPKTVGAGSLEETGSIFTLAAGVALSEPKQIEFLIKKEPLGSKILSERSLFITAPLLTMLILFGIGWYKSAQINTLQRERDEKILKVAKLEDLRTRLAALKEKEAQIKQDLSLFPSSMTAPIPYRTVLREVNEMIPGNVTLTHLEVQSGTRSLKKTTSTSKSLSDKQGHSILHLTALAFGNDIHCLTAIAQIIERLEKSPLFGSVKLISTEENKQYNQLAIEFDIICDIKIGQDPKERL